jgi:serine acetyltransferase
VPPPPFVEELVVVGAGAVTGRVVVTSTVSVVAGAVVVSTVVDVSVVVTWPPAVTDPARRTPAAKRVARPASLNACPTGTPYFGDPAWSDDGKGCRFDPRNVASE